MRFPTILLLSVLALIACGNDDDDDAALAPASHEGVTMIVASEFDPYPEVEQQLQLLADAPGTALCLAIRKSESESPELASLIRRAAELEVPMIGWLLLEEDEGYWYEEDNFVAAEAQTLAFADWLEAQELPLDWLMFDMEMELAKTRQLEEIEAITDVIPLLQGNHDPDTYEQSRAAYAELVDELHARDYIVTAAAYPFVLPDPADGDSDIQDAFNTPVIDVGFDEIYFMFYRTTIETLFGFFPGADIVYRAGLDSQTAFGDVGVIGLGTIAGVGMVSEAGFTDPEALREDVAAAYAAGHSKTFVFSLDGMVATGEPEAWLDLRLTDPVVPEPDPITETIAGVFELIDTLFD